MLHHDHSTETLRVEFIGHTGEPLAGRFDKPAGQVRAAALFAHCFTCSKDIAAARRIAGRLAAMGVAVLRFDFTGLGHSAGEFANTNFSTNVQDLVQAANYMQDQGFPPTILIGHSLGGAAILQAAQHIASAKAVVSIGAPFDPHHVTHNFGAKYDDILANGAAEVCLAGRAFTIKKDFIEDVSRVNMAAAVGHLDKALLVMHAPLDDVVGIDQAGALFKAARHPKSFITLDDADHLITQPEHADYAASVIAVWAQKYVPALIADQQQGTQKSASLGEDGVRVQEVQPDKFRQDVYIGQSHHLLADEPISFGGENTGPSPYQFLAAGLGACTTMTLRMYAKRKNIPMAGVFVDVRHSKIHADDCAHCVETTGKVDQFTRVITLEGALSAEQKADLLRVADKCPVHKTLESQAHIVTKLAE
jgi:putative redox protein